MGSTVLWVQRPDEALWLFWGCLAGCAASYLSQHITVWSASYPLTPGQNPPLITTALWIAALCPGALASEVLASTELWCCRKSQPHLWPHCRASLLSFVLFSWALYRQYVKGLVYTSMQCHLQEIWTADVVLRPNMATHSFQWKLLIQHCKCNVFFASYICHSEAKIICKFKGFKTLNEDNYPVS